MTEAVAPPGPEKGSPSGEWTLGRVLSWSTSFLQGKETSSPRLDAELLLAHSLGLTRIQLYTNFDQPLSLGERDSFKGLLRRRAHGEPVAYILGYREFMRHRFRVTPDVLVPRPDTETLVECAIEYARTTLPARCQILDIGTGSGCIAISIAAVLREAIVVAWDISESALKIARDNAVNADCSHIDFRLVDMLQESSWAPSLSADGATCEGFDLIVSNPPYIAEAERQGLERTVRDFEPALALFAGDDGLTCYRSLATYAARLLRPGGKLMLEIGSTQAQAVVELLRAEGWQSMTVKQDYGRRDRVVSAVRPES